ncbi:MAG: cell division protein FtsZ [Candidatus Aenigmarchaeota archaeon]|nr:cell division protein FtsZ [Candidatus Aenigmarchaeota archaeon]
MAELGIVDAKTDATGIGDFKSVEPRIVVIGCGGGGSNTVNRLSEIGVSGAATVAVNTDARHLQSTNAQKKILIGRLLTKGLGAGGYPDIGRKAAEESKKDIENVLRGSDLVFLTCGLGGGTGTGSAPVVAGIAKSMGAIVIACVTIPLRIEGARIAKAEDGLQKLKSVCDTVIVIENQRLLEVAGKRPLKEAFGIADGLVATMIKGITETISVPSLVNLDYADIKAIMSSGGVATIGIGESDGSERAREAVARSLAHPLLDVDYTGASGALIQVIGGEDMKLEEVSEIGETVSKHMDSGATVMWGARIVPEMSGKIQVISIVTGVKSPYIVSDAPARQKPVSSSSKPAFTFE